MFLKYYIHSQGSTICINYTTPKSMNTSVVFIINEQSTDRGCYSVLLPYWNVNI